MNKKETTDLVNLKYLIQEALLKKKIERRKSYSKSFWSFAKQIDKKFFTEKKVKLKELAGLLQKVTDGEIEKLIINVPVRTGKSYILTVFCAYLIGENPQIPLMRNAHTTNLYERFSRDLKNIIIKPTYQEIYPKVKLKTDDKGIKSWSVQGAKQLTFFGGGVDKGISGLGAEFGIVDDPVKGVKQAYSETYNAGVFLWYLTEHRTRFDPNIRTPEIVVMTRWSKNDLTGRLIEEEGVASVNGKIPDINKYNYQVDGWHLFVYPALNKNDKSFDEAIHPTDKLLKIRKTLMSTNPEMWYLLYQQEVVESRNKLFSDNELQYFRYPDLMEILMSKATWFTIYDPADEGKDHLFVGLFAELKGLFYLVDVIYTDKAFEEASGKIVKMYNKLDGKIRQSYYEKQGLGRMFSIAVRNALAQVNIFTNMIGFNNTGNKEARIKLRAGEIKLKIRFRRKREVNNPMYKKFMIHLTDYSTEGSNGHKKDASDGCASLFEAKKTNMIQITTR